jgi:hypothetical protein
VYLCAGAGDVERRTGSRILFVSELFEASLECDFGGSRKTSGCFALV